ncbi:MAG: translesion error-prone DNA polymerase V autoproteolytic subunit [Xanthomonadales bacterium]|nr:translesion error-prone DNA polymerase V autoproteolytic subunit [Xanthomonadales bacterium]
MPSSPFSHGGRRAGAGRKTGSGRFGEATRNVRVPGSQVEVVQAYFQTCCEPTVASDPLPLTPSPSEVALTLFAAHVPAGFPSPAEDYVEDVIDLNRHLIILGHESSTFILRVKGWSMMGAGIHDGDEIVVDRSLTPRQGDIVVACVNNDLTVKRLGRVDSKLALLPENPHFKPIVFDDDESPTLEIWCVVTRCLRNLRL